jgi:hypothetical protein
MKRRWDYNKDTHTWSFKDFEISLDASTLGYVLKDLKNNTTQWFRLLSLAKQRGQSLFDNNSLIAPQGPPTITRE